MSMERLEELLVEELRDLYDAEKQLVRALPKMAKAASDEELQTAFRKHLEETKGQVQRLERAFELLGQRARSKPCKGMRGLVEEGQEVMQEDAEDILLDSAIIGAAQKVEHYEISGYGTARTIAQAAGKKEVAQLLQQTLDEEGRTDKLLTQISKRLLKESGRASASSAGVGEKERGETTRSAGSRGRSASGARSGNSGTKSAASARNSGSKTRSASSRGNSPKGPSGGKVTTNHEEIRRWAEERGAKPACVRGTGGKGDIGILRLDFPGYSGGDSLQKISWDDWFEKFDERGLALLYQETTARGRQKSNFNKIINRETAMAAR